MNIKQAKIKLEKINALFRNISMDESSITDIEKDLMRSYIQQFYEAFLNIEISESKGSETFKPVEKEVKKVSTSEKIEAKIEKQKDEAINQPSETKIIEPTPVKEKNSASPKSYSQDQTVSKTEITEAPKKESKVETEEIKEQPSDTENKSSKKKSEPVIIDEELEAIFDVPEAKELSDKLSRLPIKDLTKAFGVNEKIFTINELFNGDKDRFKKTIKHLNTCSSYTEAKEYLIKKVAAQNDWASRSKKKKAINFIRLVHRRYS